jgi:putative cytidylate kinase
MKKIITISRTFGAGGTSVASKLSKDLSIEYYDKALISKIAREANLDLESYLKHDEKLSANFGFTQSLFDFYNKPLNDQIFDAQKKVIRDLANKESCIIIGRNANSILKEFDNTLHIFLYADYEWRFNRMKERMSDSSDSEITELIKKIDKAREKYCKYNTKTVYGDAKNYDLCLNTSKLGIDKCVELIESALN